MSIQLLRFSGSQIKPKDDANIFELFSPAKMGVIYGVEISSLGADQVHISSGRGIYRGRDFVIEEETIHVALSPAGTSNGRIYIHIDLNNDEKPIEIKSVCRAVLPELIDHDDFNQVTSEGEMEIARYAATETAVSSITATYDTLDAVSKRFGHCSFEVKADGKPYVNWIDDQGNKQSKKLGSAEGTAVASQVLSGATFFSSASDDQQTGTLKNNKAKTIIASAVSSDENYTYLDVPEECVVDKSSKVATLNCNLGSIEILHNSNSRASFNATATKNYKSIFFIEGDGDGNTNYCSVAGKAIHKAVRCYHDNAYTNVYRADDVKKGDSLSCLLCIYVIGIT